MNNLRSKVSSLREYLTPVTHKSTFKTSGEITPEEFVAAGDYLVYKFPTWQWSPTPKKSLEKSFLPSDKQFLVTRKVPSYQRALSYLAGGDEDYENEEEDENGWTTTHVKKKASGSAAKAETESGKVEAEKADAESLEEIQDIDDDDFEPAANPGAENDKSDNGGESHKRRNYDLFITYSTSYRVPKMYLVGYDADGIPLTPEQMFEDISSDYRDKTATIEKAPFLVDTTSVSIHPCRHATVMKILMNRAQIAAFQKKNKEDLVTKGISKLGIKDSESQEPDIAGEEEDWENVENVDDEDVIRVDQYLVIFLKFIASVTPGINHDNTMDAL